tara:strand:+ start:208 stop:393 length:186 start_codon:yes stop_codon:yes gene_type:complete
MPKDKTIYTLVDLEDGCEYRMTVPMILDYINEGRNPEWEDYDETDWQEGLREFGILEVKNA